MDNPYAAMAGQDQASYVNAMAQNAPSQGAGMYGSPTSQPMMGSPVSAQSYPSYPNQYGLGSQTPQAPAIGGIQAKDNGSSSTAGSVTVNQPDTSSRGFNPYSLAGEANSRGA